jgi:hydrogenase expression/formation protein HypE
VESDLKSDSCSLNHTIIALLDEFGENIHLLRDPTRGGVASTLNEVCSQVKFGIEVDQNSFIVDDQVSGLCELFGMDPLYVANEGLFVAFVKNSIAEKFLKKLKQLDHGENASIVGKVTTEHPDKVILNSAIGGKRVLQMLPGAQLPRIC